MISLTTRAAIESEIKKRRLPADFYATVERWYVPLAQHINDCYRLKEQTLLISFNGAQGSGKSTLTAFLALILDLQFNLFSVEISIDDFYLTRAERKKLAQEVHPLLATRGVPGTHDVSLAQKTLFCLRNCSARNPCDLPRFDKSLDDRVSKDGWSKITRPVKVILFEGWCNNAPVQSDEELELPVNELERGEDKEGIWRRYVNTQLALYHRELFDQADMQVLLQAPGFEKVYEWRGLQEKKLAQDASGKHQGVMNEAQLKRFIQHYERITRHALHRLPETSDIVIRLDDEHAINAMNMQAC